MSNMAKGIASALTGSEIETSWSDILADLDSSTTPAKQTETEEEVKSRLLAKLNGREGA
jgi:predicted alternative tryptophan synthase beta-subunit